mgnify:CR=1 FL=1
MLTHSVCCIAAGRACACRRTSRLSMPHRRSLPISMCAPPPCSHGFVTCVELTESSEGKGRCGQRLGRPAPPPLGLNAVGRALALFVLGGGGGGHLGCMCVCVCAARRRGRGGLAAPRLPNPAPPPWSGPPPPLPPGACVPPGLRPPTCSSCRGAPGRWCTTMAAPRRGPCRASSPPASEPARTHACPCRVHPAAFGACYAKLLVGQLCKAIARLPILLPTTYVAPCLASVAPRPLRLVQPFVQLLVNALQQGWRQVAGTQQAQSKTVSMCRSAGPPA